MLKCTSSLPTILFALSPPFLRLFHAVPLTYARHTSRFLSLFCLTAPIALVGELGEHFLHRIAQFLALLFFLFDLHQLILISLSLSLPPPNPFLFSIFFLNIFLSLVCTVGSYVVPFVGVIAWSLFGIQEIGLSPLHCITFRYVLSCLS